MQNFVLGQSHSSLFAYSGREYICITPFHCRLLEILEFFIHFQKTCILFSIEDMACLDPLSLRQRDAETCAGSECFGLPSWT